MPYSLENICGDRLFADDLVLDLGTKDGSDLKGYTLDDCPATVVGIDISNSQFPADMESDFVLGDGRQLPFDTDIFDYVYCSAVLEHVNNSGSLLAESARVLKPSGTAHFSFPNRMSLLRPHSEVPRYYSVLPKPIGRIFSSYFLSEEEYYEHALFPLTPISARYYLHKHFDTVDYTMQMSGELISDRKFVRKLFKTVNIFITKPPFKWPYELCWPNASYRCKSPKINSAD